MTDEEKKKIFKIIGDSMRLATAGETGDVLVLHCYNCKSLTVLHGGACKFCGFVVGKQ